MAVRIGTDERETLTGTSGPDTILGDAGDDTLVGRGGPDVLVGGPPGNVSNTDQDILRGGRGDDVLLGGSDADKLFGGPGRDRFVFQDDEDASRPGDVLTGVRRGDEIPDIIHGFDARGGLGIGDIIDLRGIDANPMRDGDQPFQRQEGGNVDNLSSGEIVIESDVNDFRETLESDERLVTFQVSDERYTIEVVDITNPNAFGFNDFIL